MVLIHGRTVRYANRSTPNPFHMIPRIAVLVCLISPFLRAGSLSNFFEPPGDQLITRNHGRTIAISGDLVRVISCEATDKMMEWRGTNPQRGEPGPSSETEIVERQGGGRGADEQYAWVQVSWIRDLLAFQDNAENRGYPREEDFSHGEKSILKQTPMN